MKDYYRILQVHPEAEKEVITSAYRHLIRKHHPDTLDPDKREDPDILETVRNLNEAYEVLGNEEKRRKYDEEYKWHKKRYKSQFATKTNVEKRLYLIRCGKTKRTFKMHLARPQGSSAPFTVLGFERLDDIPQIAQSTSKRKPFLWQILERFTKVDRFPKESTNRQTSQSEKEIQQLLTTAATLTMGEINWNGHACPDCGSVIENANGTLATWSGCSTCGHIKCVGSVEHTRRGIFSTCPWCGKKNKITRSVPVGSKDHLSLKGKMGDGILVNVSNGGHLLKDEKEQELKSGKN